MFHPSTADEKFPQHLTDTGHTGLTEAEIDRYIDRICQVCIKARGVKAFGFFQMGATGIPLYGWVCKTCLTKLVSMPTAS